MRIFSIPALAILCVVALGGFVKPQQVRPLASVQQSCIRHQPVSALALSQELTSVALNCQAHPTCPMGSYMGNFHTKNIPGFNMSGPWVWQGLSTTSFTIITQNNLLISAIATASSAAYLPPGQVITNMQFYFTVVVGPEDPSYYLIGDIVTYGQCLKPVRIPNFPPPNK